MQLPQLGEQLQGRYRLDEIVSSSALTVVFGARDVGADRPVEVKVLLPEAGGSYHPHTRARFEREVRAVAGLRSPHSVRLFDYGASTSGALFMVFERVAGLDLRQWVEAHGPMPPAAAVHVLSQVLDGLGEAHAAGLLHRAITPHNVRLFSYMNDPYCAKIVNFGLARSTDDGHPGITATGELVGALRFMAPEQLLRETVTLQTDLYGVGLIGLELLLGPQAMGLDSTVDPMERIHAPSLVNARHLEALGPLGPVLQKLTARDPADRYASATLARSALRGPPKVGWSDGRNIAGPIEPPTTTHDAPARRKRPRVGTVALAVIGVASIGGVAGWFLRPEPPPPPPPVRPAVPAQPRPTPVAVVDEPQDDGGVDHGAPEEPRRPTPARCTRKRGYGRLTSLDGLETTEWMTYVPPNLAEDAQPPLVVLVHQQGHTTREFVETAGFVPLADEHGFIILGPIDDRFAPWEPARESRAYVREGVELARLELCIDERRVFAVGHGSGGTLVEQLACDGWMAGFSTHAVARERGITWCDTGPLPFLMFFPRDSRYEPFEGGESSTGRIRESVHEVTARWKTRNGCRGEGRKIFDEDGSECWAFDCDTAFRACHLEGGSGWPGTRRRDAQFRITNGDGPEPSAKFPMARLAWELFASVPPGAP